MVGEECLGFKRKEMQNEGKRMEAWGKKFVGKINDENMSMYIQWSATLSTVWSTVS